MSKEIHNVMEKHVSYRVATTTRDQCGNVQIKHYD